MIGDAVLFVSAGDKAVGAFEVMGKNNNLKLDQWTRKER